MNNYSLLALTVTVLFSFIHPRTHSFCFVAILTNCCSLCNEVVRLSIYSLVSFYFQERAERVAKKKALVDFNSEGKKGSFDRIHCLWTNC